MATTTYRFLLHNEFGALNLGNITLGSLQTCFLFVFHGNQGRPTQRLPPGRRREEARRGAWSTFSAKPRPLAMQTGKTRLLTLLPGGGEGGAGVWGKLDACNCGYSLQFSQAGRWIPPGQESYLDTNTLRGGRRWSWKGTKVPQVSVAPRRLSWLISHKMKFYFQFEAPALSLSTCSFLILSHSHLLSFWFLVAHNQ